MSIPFFIYLFIFGSFLRRKYIIIKRIKNRREIRGNERNTKRKTNHYITLEFVLISRLHDRSLVLQVSRAIDRVRVLPDLNSSVVHIIYNSI